LIRQAQWITYPDNVASHLFSVTVDDERG